MGCGAGEVAGAGRLVWRERHQTRATQAALAIVNSSTNFHMWISQLEAAGVKPRRWPKRLSAAHGK